MGKRLSILLLLASLTGIATTQPVHLQNEHNKVFDLSGQIVPDIFLVNCSNITIKNADVKSGGKNLIQILNSNDITLENIEADGLGLSRHVLAICASNNVSVRNSTFQNATHEVAWVGPGHPWQRTDASFFGYDYKPGSSFDRPGMNVIAFPGDQNQNRKAVAENGKIRIDFIKDSKGYFWRSDFRSENQQPNHLTWLVWDGSKTVPAKLLEFYEDYGVVEADVADGEVIWYAYDQRFFSKNIRFERCNFKGSEFNSGLTLYAVDGFTLIDNVSRETRDYGFGVEWSKNGQIIRNYVAGTTDQWNRIELVYYCENVVVASSSQTGIRPWGAPCINVEVLNGVRLEIGPGPPGRSVYWLDRVRTPELMNQTQYKGADGYIKGTPLDSAPVPLDMEPVGELLTWFGVTACSILLIFFFLR